jgi:hypothetical protein
MHQWRMATTTGRTPKGAERAGGDWDGEGRRCPAHRSAPQPKAQEQRRRRVCAQQVYSSHEGMLLPYEAALTRKVGAARVGTHAVLWALWALRPR